MGHPLQCSIITALVSDSGRVGESKSVLMECSVDRDRAAGTPNLAWWVELSPVGGALDL